MIHASEVVPRRLSGQLLTTPRATKASDVVRALGAVQAQDYGGAKWALAQRTRGATDAAIEREFSEGAILRTHVLRPTWHFVVPKDIRWMLALTAPRVRAAMAYYDRQLGLDAGEFRRSNTALTKALTGGQHLTRPELGTVLERAGVRITSGQRLGHLMLRAELDAVVCSGPRRGKQFTYALLEERVPPVAPLERDEALRKLTSRYFSTRGPATEQDFAWWSGLTMSDVKRGLQIAGRRLQRATIDGRELWFAERTVPTASPNVYLLPNYDEYFIGYKDRTAIAQRLGTTQAATRGNAFMAHVVFVNGQLVGGWKRAFQQKAVVVKLDLVTRLTRAERARIARETRRFGVFLGLQATVRG